MSEGQTIKNGDTLTGHPGWCDFCSYKFGGSSTPMAAMYLDGKFYHPQCFPKAVDIWKAVQAVREAK